MSADPEQPVRPDCKQILGDRIHHRFKRPFHHNVPECICGAKIRFEEDLPTHRSRDRALDWFNEHLKTIRAAAVAAKKK